MEVQTVKEKKTKTTTTDNTLYDDLKSMGIPVSIAIFQSVVSSPLGTPETAFYAKGGKAHRTATMWYTPHGLLCEAKGWRKIVPLPNVKDVTLI